MGEEGGERQLDAEAWNQSTEQANREQRMATQFEEVVVTTDLLELE
jgi:predicted AAA+ superfamily ATPase